MQSPFEIPNYLFSLYAVTPLVVGLLTVGLGLAVLIRERASFVSGMFCLLTLVGAVWLLSYVGVYCALKEPVALMWVRIENMAVTFLPSFVYLFTLSVVQRLRQFREFVLISFLLSGLFCASVVKTDWFIAGLYLYPWGYYAHYGPLSIPFLVFLSALLIASLRLYWVEYRRAPTEMQKRRFKVFLTAFSISYVGSVDFLPAFGIPFYPVGYLPIFAFLIMVAQAIWQYRLIEITPAFAAEQIIALMPSALLVVDQEGVIEVANQEAARLFRTSTTDILEKPISAVSGGVFSKERMDALIKKGMMDRYETVYRGSQGQTVYLDVSVAPIRDRAGVPVGAVCIARDVTERTRYERLLEEARNYAESIVDTVREPLVVLSSNLRVKSANRAFYQTFQLSPEETVNRRIYELGPGPWNMSKMRALLETLPKDTPFENMELDYEFPSIGRRTLLLNARRLYGEGYHMEMILLAMEDITQRKEWERQIIQQAQEIAFSEEALRKQTRILQSILASMGDGVIVADDKGNFLLFNPAAERIFGVGATKTPPQEWTRRYGCYLPDMVTPYPPEKMPLARAIRGEAVNNAELFIRNPNKPEGAWLNITARPLKDDSGTLKGGVMVLRDVTERKKAELQLQQALENLRRSHEELKSTQLQLIQAAKMESIGRLAAGVAHEVKNPLAVILQGLSYLSKSLTNTKDENVAVVLGYVKEAVKRADVVIRGLLDFSTSRTLEMGVENLNSVVEESLLLVKHEIEKAHINLVKGLKKPLPPLKLDRMKMEQVFVNLLENAIHAMPQGGVLTIRTYARSVPEANGTAPREEGNPRPEGEQFVIAEVEDTGVGVSEEMLSRIFDPFFTTKPMGKGTGLGLTVSKNIVEMHGGTIEAKRREPSGLKFTITLKAALVDEVEAVEKGHAHG